MVILKQFILKISSLRFAILLIIFIAISSSIGTFVPQGNNPQEYIDNYDNSPFLGFIAGESLLYFQ